MFTFTFLNLNGADIFHYTQMLRICDFLFYAFVISYVTLKNEVTFLMSFCIVVLLVNCAFVTCITNLLAYLLSIICTRI